MNFSSVQGNGVIDPPGDRDVLPQYAGVSAKVCKGCGRMKTLGQFNRHPGTPDGYSGTCKECFGNAVKRGHAVKQVVSAPEEQVAVEPQPEGASLPVAPVKVCTGCNLTKSLDDFWHNKDNPDGYFKQCKECYGGVGMTQDKLAEMLGMSQAYIAKYVQMLSLPEEVQALVEEGNLTPGHAAALAGVKQPDVDWQGTVRRTAEQSLLSMAKQTVEGNWSVRNLEESVKRHNGYAIERFNYAEAGRKRQEEQVRLAQESERLRAYEEGAKNDEEADQAIARRAETLALYEREMTLWRETQNARLLERKKLLNDVIKPSLQWGSTEMGALSHVQFLGMFVTETLSPYGQENTKGKEILKATTINQVLSVIVNTLLSKLEIGYDGTSIQTYGDHHKAAQAVWDINGRLQKLIEERDLADPPQPVHPDVRAKLEATPDEILPECESCGEAVVVDEEDPAVKLLVPSGVRLFDSGVMVAKGGAVYCAECGPGREFCSNCGCTNEVPCEEGCEWVKPDLCSACVQADAVENVTLLAEELVEQELRGDEDRLVRCPECRTGALFIDSPGAPGIGSDIWACSNSECGFVAAHDQVKDLVGKDILPCGSCGHGVFREYLYCELCDTGESAPRPALASLGRRIAQVEVEEVTA